MWRIADVTAMIYTQNQWINSEISNSFKFIFISIKINNEKYSLSGFINESLSSIENWNLESVHWLYFGVW